MRLSFIVPFYNAEPYIEECIRSLYAQDIPQEEYEVICVDDCTPDGSRAIVERLQKKYPTLRLLVHDENKRQGGARNTGLREAKGQYIWFVDADDYIAPKCLGGMLDMAEKENLDVLKFHCQYSHVQPESHMLRSEKVTTGSELTFEIEKSISILNRCNSSVMQLIGRDFLANNKIEFAEKMQYEDDDFAYQIFAYADRAYLIGVAPYVIRTTPDSTTRRRNDVRRARDIYAQALRMAKLDKRLSQRDKRWHSMISASINNSISHCVFRMLKGFTVTEQLHFWICDRRKVWLLKPYLSNKSYAKLCSYMVWKLLQN